MSTHKPVLAVDLDSVLAEIMVPLIAFHNAHYHTTTQFEDHYTYDLTIMWHCTSDEVVQRVYEFYKTPAMDTVMPIVGSVEAITTLAEIFDIHVITARPQKIYHKTKDWVQKHFGNAISTIHTTDLLSYTHHKKTLKSSVCKEIQAVAAIDDAIEYAEDIASIPIPVMLFDSPWNRTYSSSPHITRVTSWKEIQKKLASFLIRNS